MTMRRSHLVVGCAFAAVAAFAQPQSPPAPANAAGVGDLLVAPTRVIFEGRVRSAELALINTGTTPATYRISFMHLRMNAKGDLVEVDKPAEGERFADDLVRYSPRQVVLDPHVTQTVRVQLRLPAELAAGEYRVNLLFRAIPPADTVTPPADTAETSGFQIRLTPIYGVSIPIFVRHGDTSATAAMSGLTLEANNAVSFVLSRSGNRSVYGALTARFTPAGGKEQVVGVVHGVAVYSPLASRSVIMPLQPPAGVTLRHGRLRLTYVDAEQPSGGGEVLAETAVDLP